MYILYNDYKIGTKIDLMQCVFCSCQPLGLGENNNG